MDEIELDPVSDFNYLGITINENVKWKNHLNKLACNISKKVGIILKLSHLISCDILLSIYNSLILPHITYGILAWSYESDIIFGLQKKAVRAMTCAKYTAHTDPIFQKLNLLKLKDMHQIQQLKLYFKLNQNHLPEYFNTILTLKACDVHNHLTRNRSDLCINRVNHTFAEKCIRYSLLKTVVLFCSVLFCSVLFCSVLFCSVLFCSVLFCSVLFCSVLFCSVLFCSVLFCSVLFCSVLFCSVLFCSVLFCSVLFCSALFCPVLSCSVLFRHSP